MPSRVMFPVIYDRTEGRIILSSEVYIFVINKSYDTTEKGGRKEVNAVNKSFRN